MEKELQPVLITTRTPASFFPLFRGNYGSFFKCANPTDLDFGSQIILDVSRQLRADLRAKKVRTSPPIFVQGESKRGKVLWLGFVCLNRNRRLSNILARPIDHEC